MTFPRALIILLVLLGAYGCFAVASWMLAERDAIDFSRRGPNFALAVERANTLFDAVTQFHGKEQRYPESLDELIPRYVKSLPSVPYWGQRWKYRPSPFGFCITFGVGPHGYPHCTKCSEREALHFDE